ncbi:MAG: hypothetical protein E3J35_09460 [Methanomassiliicoccales archaeon]|nr:MAG: hypothetical protein E3J35_09460 [Methanomassiliicoccales archaeon]
MGEWHDRVEREIVDEYGDKWDVTPSKKRRNYVILGEKKKDKILFNPDVVIRTKDGTRLRLVAEISETSPSRPVDFLGILQAADLSLSGIGKEDPGSISGGFRMVFLIKDDKKAEKFKGLLKKSKENLGFLEGKVRVYHIEKPNEVRNIDLLS